MMIAEEPENHGRGWVQCLFCHKTLRIKSYHRKHCCLQMSDHLSGREYRDKLKGLAIVRYGPRLYSEGPARL